MTPAVICYVPGSGGVKLGHLLKMTGAVQEFDFMTNSHTPLYQGISKFEYSLRQPINNLRSGWQPSVMEPSSIPCDSNSELFPSLDHNHQLISSSFAPMGAYVGPDPAKMSHCMNLAVTRLRYPNRFQIKILCDLRLALRRWWKVFASTEHPKTAPRVPENLQDTVSQLTDKHQFIAKLIIMHIKYYSVNYDTNADYVINLHTGQDEFSKFMRHDLQLCQNKDFDHVWQHLEHNHDFMSLWQKIIDKMT